MELYYYDAEGYLISVMITNDKAYDVPKNSTTIKPPQAGENQVCQFDGNKWILVNKHPILVPDISNKDRREREYGTNPLIEWQGRDITVDQANLVYLQYLAEGSEKTYEVQALIITAKESIRQTYPDEGEV